MSNLHNQEIMERLYDEAYEQLVQQHQSWRAYMSEDELHNATVELANQLWENYCD